MEVAKPFGPLSLGFENHILTHCYNHFGTSKGIFKRISNIDVFVLYYPLQKLHINWAMWFCEYTVERFVDNNSSSSIPWWVRISCRCCMILLEKFFCYTRIPTLTSGNIILRWKDLKRRDSTQSMQFSRKSTQSNLEPALLISSWLLLCTPRIQTFLKMLSTLIAFSIVMCSALSSIFLMVIVKLCSLFPFVKT